MQSPRSVCVMRNCVYCTSGVVRISERLKAVCDSPVYLLAPCWCKFSHYFILLWDFVNNSRSLPCWGIVTQATLRPHAALIAEPAGLLTLKSGVTVTARYVNNSFAIEHSPPQRQEHGTVYHRKWRHHEHCHHPSFKSQLKTCSFSLSCSDLYYTIILIVKWLQCFGTIHLELYELTGLYNVVVHGAQLIGMRESARHLRSSTAPLLYIVQAVHQNPLRRSCFPLCRTHCLELSSYWHYKQLFTDCI